MSACLNPHYYTSSFLLYYVIAFLHLSYFIILLLYYFIYLSYFLTVQTHVMAPSCAWHGRISLRGRQVTVAGMAAFRYVGAR